MKYLSIDIETTGLNPLTCDVLEIGAFLEDTENPAGRENLPAFHTYLWRDVYRGEPYALAMNAHIFQKMLELRKTENVDNGNYETRTLVKPEEVWMKLNAWIYAQRAMWTDPKAFINNPPTLVVAGKNVSGFDLPFLKQLPAPSLMPKFHHRVIDPGMMYFDPRNDNVPPDLKECKKRAKLPEHVSHEALDDAWDVIQLVREKFPLI
jgi:oligoribonuclease (3'-5' exoribonuclease)